MQDGTQARSAPFCLVASDSHCGFFCENLRVLALRFPGFNAGDAEISAEGQRMALQPFLNPLRGCSPNNLQTGLLEVIYALLFQMKHVFYIWLLMLWGFNASAGTYVQLRTVTKFTGELVKSRLEMIFAEEDAG